MGELPTPQSLFCPRCGDKMSMEKIEDPLTQVKLKDGGYATGARGDCGCGVTSILAVKKMPDNPTFTLMFNIYKLDVKE